MSRSSTDSLREFAERRITVAREHEKQAKWYRKQAGYFDRKNRPASAKRMVQHALHHENRASEARLAAQQARSKAEELEATPVKKEMAG